MVSVWNRKSGKGLAVKIAVAIVLASLANAFAFWANPEAETKKASAAYDPPGYIVGLVWVGLFTGLGIARWLVLGTKSEGIAHRDWILIFVLFCAACPLYTMGLRSVTLGLLGNVATGAFALWIAKRVQNHSMAAAGLLVLVAAWVSFASVLTLLQIKEGGIRCCG